MKKLLVSLWLLLGASPALAQTTPNAYYPFQDSSLSTQTVSVFRNCPTSSEICPPFVPVGPVGNFLGNRGGIAANPGFAGEWGIGATGSAVPASALYMAYNSGGNLTGWDKSVNQSQVWVVNDSPLISGQWGIGLLSATAPLSGITNGGTAQNVEPTKVGTGSLIGLFTDLVGKLIVAPYTNRENAVWGAASTTGSSAVNLIAAQGAGVKIYITDFQCGRTDTAFSAMTVQINDPRSTQWVIPSSGGGGGGNNISPKVPIAMSANTTLTFTPSSSATTLYCAAQGYTGY